MGPSNSADLPGTSDEKLGVKATGLFGRLLAERGMSLAVTVVPNRLLLISALPDNGLKIRDATLPKPWGLAVHGGNMAVAATREIIFFAGNTRLAPHNPHMPQQFDAIYTPRMSYFTGECAIHDLAIQGQVALAANTRFSCICRVDGEFNFTPIWKPPFISAILPEDRCHLNGFALDGDHLRYVTAFGQFDSPGEWRKHEPAHGIVMDVNDNRLLADDLSMPHSPRLIEGRLFVLESGQGRVLEIDRLTGARRCLAELPGLVRGLCHHGGILFVGLSRGRRSKTGWHLPLYDRHPELKTGIAALDLRTGQLLGLLEFTSGARELFDVQPLVGINRPDIMDVTRWNGLSAIETPGAGFWMQLETPEDKELGPQPMGIEPTKRADTPDPTGF